MHLPLSLSLRKRTDNSTKLTGALVCRSFKLSASSCNRFLGFFGDESKAWQFMIFSLVDWGLIKRFKVKQQVSFSRVHVNYNKQAKPLKKFNLLVLRMFTKQLRQDDSLILTNWGFFKWIYFMFSRVITNIQNTGDTRFLIQVTQCTIYKQVERKTSKTRNRYIKPKKYEYSIRYTSHVDLKIGQVESVNFLSW